MYLIRIMLYNKTITLPAREPIVDTIKGGIAVILDKAVEEVTQAEIEQINYTLKKISLDNDIVAAFFEEELSHRLWSRLFNKLNNKE